MSLHHFSHEHPLILLLKEDKRNINGDDDHEMLCYGCHTPILPPSAADGGGDDDVYTCGDGACDDAFYLHKKCAELRKEIQHPMHNRHPLTLQSPPRYGRYCICHTCGSQWKGFTYRCYTCQFYICTTCAVEDRLLRHVGHEQHTLSLMHKKAKFKCDACGTKAKDSSYVCNSCEFWMHKSCALSPKIVEAGEFHRHPLVLTYSLPDIHRSFPQKCRVCNYRVERSYWLYYCDKCTYFVHVKCLGRTSKNISADEDNSDHHDYELFPVHSKESFIDLMAHQFTKENLNTNTNLEKGGDQAAEEEPDHCTQINHWSHQDHPLILSLEESMKNIINDETTALVCNGCIQPISTTDSQFYGCIKCNYFLHKFCVDLPYELPAGGACSPHPQHRLLLAHSEYYFVGIVCATCGLVTNGFCYVCETCDLWFDIRCCFIPKKIKHKSHPHPMCSSGTYDSNCKACGNSTMNEDIFACIKSSWMSSCDFHTIHKSCALLPGTMRHRWDPHPIHLIYPPFDHQGQIYCEICEDEINTNYWLYHCRECGHSFHTFCLRRRHNSKVGGYELVPGLHKHALTFVVKKKKEHHRPFSCSGCNEDLGIHTFVFECVNCDMLFCVQCVSSNL